MHLLFNSITVSLCQFLSLSLCPCPVFSWYVFSILFKIIIKKYAQFSASFVFVPSVQFHFYQHFKSCVWDFGVLLLYLDLESLVSNGISTWKGVHKSKKHPFCLNKFYDLGVPTTHSKSFILSKSWEMAACHNLKGWLTIAKTLDAKCLVAKVFKALGRKPSLIFFFFFLESKCFSW